MVMGTYTKQNYLFKKWTIIYKTKILFSKITLDAKKGNKTQKRVNYDACPASIFCYLRLGELVVVSGAAGGDIWLSARNPQGPTLLPVSLLQAVGPRREAAGRVDRLGGTLHARSIDGAHNTRAGIGTGAGGASLAPRLRRLLYHLVPMLAR